MAISFSRRIGACRIWLFRTLSRWELSWISESPYVVPMNTNNSSVVKKLHGSDSRKPRPTSLTATIVSKLMAIFLEHYMDFFYLFFCFCFQCISRVWGMMDATCYVHLLWSIMWIEEGQSSLVPSPSLTELELPKKKTSYFFFFFVTVSIICLCSYIRVLLTWIFICWLLKGDAQLMPQVPADSVDLALSFSLITTVLTTNNMFLIDHIFCNMSTPLGRILINRNSQKFL